MLFMLHILLFRAYGKRLRENLFDKRGKTSLGILSRMRGTFTMHEKNVSKNARPLIYGLASACYRSMQSDGGWPYLTSQLRAMLV